MKKIFFLIKDEKFTHEHEDDKLKKYLNEKSFFLLELNEVRHYLNESIREVLLDKRESPTTHIHRKIINGENFMGKNF